MSLALVVQLFLGICFGGVAGAVLKYAFDRWQGKVQIIRLRQTISRLSLRLGELPHRIQADITITTPSGIIANVDEIYVVSLTIENTSNRDFEIFRFGLSFPFNVLALDETTETVDHHHTVVTTSTPKIPEDIKDEEGWLGFAQSAVIQQRDYQLAPFNRGDSCTFKYTFAPIRVMGGTRPDDAGGQIAWVNFERSSGAITADNLRASTPMVGVRILESVNSSRRWRFIRPLLGVMTGILLSLFVPKFIAFASYYRGGRANQVNMTTPPTSLTIATIALAVPTFALVILLILLMSEEID